MRNALPRLASSAVVAAALMSSGCSPEAAAIAVPVGAAAGTLYLSQVPGNEIYQTYYVGIFDPRDQMPPSVYRIRVRGQSSSISSTRFASGWVRSEFIDALQTNAELERESGEVRISGKPLEGSIASDYRFVLFGPEGFREAPKDHRLVIMMGGDPSAFFQAIDLAMGDIAQTQLLTDSSERTAVLNQLNSRLAYDSTRAAQVMQDLNAAREASR